MKIKAVLIIFLICTIMLLNGCNFKSYDWFDTEYHFDKAIIKMPDGEIVTVDIQKWADSDGEQLTITGKDGRRYLVSSIKSVVTESDGRRCPLTILKYHRDSPKLHPTQKPVALLEYLIQTYSSEGDIVLDNCFGSGSIIIAAMNTNRVFIGFEKDEKYFNLAAERLLQKGENTTRNVVKGDKGFESSGR